MVPCVAQTIPGPSAVDWVGYLLHNGGDVFTSPVSLLTPSLLEDARKTVKLLPEHNDITCRVIEDWLDRYPDVPHLLLCDTAFFVSLPPQAAFYAVPYEFHKIGVRRYGGYGLCHEWIWRQVRKILNGPVNKVVSVFLGDHTNLAAIREGQPAETTIGFSLVEGVISSTTCGDIDPTIVFQMQSAGMSFEQIRSMLSGKSGFTALLGRPAGLLDVLNDAGAGARLAKEMFRYNVLRYIGSCAAAMGGIDALLFASPYANQCMSLVQDICQALECVGLKPVGVPSERNGTWTLAADGSFVKAFLLEYNRWQVLAELGSVFLRDQGDRK